MAAWCMGSDLLPGQYVLCRGCDSLHQVQIFSHGCAPPPTDPKARVRDLATGKLGPMVVQPGYKLVFTCLQNDGAQTEYRVLEHEPYHRHSALHWPQTITAEQHGRWRHEIAETIDKNHASPVELIFEDDMA